MTNKTAIAANELRISNYIHIKGSEFGKIGYVYSIQPAFIEVRINGVYQNFSIDDIQPIELTPEILEKAGWVKDWSGYNHKSRISFAITSDSKYLPCWDDRALSITIQYLHQLQTLFFCLTGEELPLTL